MWHWLNQISFIYDVPMRHIQNGRQNSISSFAKNALKGHAIMHPGNAFTTWKTVVLIF